MIPNGALRIAMVTEYAYPVLGGVSEHVHFLSRELVALGNEVTVVVGNTGNRARLREVDRAGERDHGYRTVRLARALPVLSNGSIARVSVGWRISRAIRAAIAGADVVHAQGLAAPTMPLFATRQARAPVNVGTFHTYVEGEHPAYRMLHRYLVTALGRLDRRIAVSDACVQGLAPSFPGRYEIIPNGVDCERFRPLRAGERRPEGPPRILFVGRFDPRNALDDLLEAAARLRAEGRDVLVQVAGDGPARRRYHAMARRLGLADRVEWLGLIHAELPRLYRESTVFAAPCTLASFGVILLEAMASGTPVVCADNIGFRQVIRDGAPGRFVPMRDSASLARALGDLLDDEALREDWSRRGRQVALERYAWPEVARRIEALYREVAAEKAGLAPALQAI